MLQLTTPILHYLVSDIFLLVLSRLLCIVCPEWIELVKIEVIYELTHQNADYIIYVDLWEGNKNMDFTDIKIYRYASLQTDYKKENDRKTLRIQRYILFRYSKDNEKYVR